MYFIIDANLSNWNPAPTITYLLAYNDWLIHVLVSLAGCFYYYCCSCRIFVICLLVDNSQELQNIWISPPSFQLLTLPISSRKKCVQVFEPVKIPIGFWYSDGSVLRLPAEDWTFQKLWTFLKVTTRLPFFGKLSFTFQWLCYDGFSLPCVKLSCGHY